MDIDIQILIKLYKEQLSKLQNENILLKAQLLQLEKNNESTSSGDDE